MNKDSRKTGLFPVTHFYFPVDHPDLPFLLEEFLHLIQAIHFIFPHSMISPAAIQMMITICPE
jgi:uncharacterized membrane protein